MFNSVDFLNKNVWFKNSIKKLVLKINTARSGRNCYGRITIRHRMSNSNKKRFQLVNNNPFIFKNEICQVLRIEYSTDRTAFIALVRALRSGVLFYILLPNESEVGSFLIINPKVYNLGLFRKLNINSAALPLYRIRRGSILFNIEQKPGAGSVLCRSAGSRAKLQSISFLSRTASVLLPSGKTAFISLYSCGFTGIASNFRHRLRVFHKAGSAFNVGIRPSVRGVAMNPVDHPHGGGEGKTSGGRISSSPWGFPTKGYKTILKKKKKHNFRIKQRYIKSLIS